MLVRIFPVAQHAHSLELDGEAAGKITAVLLFGHGFLRNGGSLPGQVGRDRGVVGGGALKDLQGESLTQLAGRRSFVAPHLG